MSNSSSNKSLNLNASEFIPKNSASKNKEEKFNKKYDNNNRNNKNKNNNYNNKNNGNSNGYRHGGYNNKSKNNNNRRQQNRSQQPINQSSNQTIEIDGPRNKRGEVELTHLVNFTFPTRQTNNHTTHYRKKKVSYEPFSKQRFINSNYQFILKSDKNYEKYLNDPDAFIEWDNIKQVIIPTSEIPLCPICLNKPIVGKVTSCGHCFCYPCILHYLKVDSKDKYKSCPLCQEIITERSLKYVKFREVEKIKVDPNKRVEFKLMKRKMDTSLAIPKTSKIDNILKIPKPNQIDLLPFAKLFYASSSYIKNEIILPAYNNLQTYLHEVELEEQAARLSNIIIVSEIPYIQMALNKIVEESKTYPDISIEAALKLLSQEEKKEIFKDTYASKIAGPNKAKSDENDTPKKSKASEEKIIEDKESNIIKQWSNELSLEEKRYQEKIEKEGGFEPAFSDDENDNNNKTKFKNMKTNNNDNNNDFDGQFILNNNNFYQSISQEINNEKNEEKNDDNGDEGRRSNEKKKKGKEEEEEEVNDNEKKESTFNQTIPSNNEHNDNVYYFYQMADGQHYYLHPLCNKILKYEYGEYAQFPETLSCRLLSLEESTINEDMRKRFKYLSHLPLSCDIVLCEIYLNDIVSHDTFKKFKPEITQLSKKRQQKIAKDNHKNKENNLKNEWMNLYKSIEHSSSQEANKSKPLLYEPVNDNLLYSNNHKKKNENNSEDFVPAALSQEAIDFLKNEQKKKAANSFAKIASSSSSNVTFSPWQGNKSTPRKKNLMVNGNEWVVNKDSGWSLDLDELVDDSDHDTPKQKEITILDIINSTKKNKNKNTTSNTKKSNDKGKDNKSIKENIKEEKEKSKEKEEIEVDKDKDKQDKEEKFNMEEGETSSTTKKETVTVTTTTNTEGLNGEFQELKKDEELAEYMVSSSKNNKLGKKKSKKVIMISNGRQRIRY